MCISISKSVKVTSIHNSDCSSPHYYSFMPPGDPAEGRNTYNDPQAKEKRLLSISFASFYGWPRMAFLCPEPSLSGAINLTFIGAGTFIIKHYSKAHYCMRTSFFLFPLFLILCASLSIDGVDDYEPVHFYIWNMTPNDIRLVEDTKWQNLICTHSFSNSRTRC